MIILKRIFSIFYSLKLAVLVILAIAVALCVGTFLESLYDTATAQYWVYRARWFHSILALLGVNIFSVAVSRYPWKWKHAPFLLAHLGILILLIGSWKTEKQGIDGNLRISEGETGSIVELDTASLVMQEEDQVRAMPVAWVPPGVHFKALNTADFGWPYRLKIDQFLSHADAEVSFVPVSDGQKVSERKWAPAVKLHLSGGPMQMSQDLWLWAGAMETKILQAGPAQFSLGEEGEGEGRPGQPQLSFFPQDDGSLVYRAISSAGQKIQGVFRKGQIVGKVIQPGWKGNVRITLAEWIPQAIISTHYKPARVQWGAQAPTAAIHVMVSPEVGVWLGLGDHVVLHLDHKEVQIGYFPRRVVLPFSIRLDRFTVERDPGSFSPAAYSSVVSVVSGLSEKHPEKHPEKQVTISMNEPLELGGYTVYQASYEDAHPRPVTSIFSVNRDPGRVWKYLGSALIVLGSAMLFGAKYRRVQAQPLPVEAPVSVC